MSGTTVSGNIFRRCGKSSSSLGKEHISAHIILDSCHGLTFTSNSCAAGRETDRGVGSIVPKFGIVTDNLDYIVISSNVWYKEFCSQMILDEGNNGENYLFVNNVDCKY